MPSSGEPSGLSRLVSRVAHVPRPTRTAALLFGFAVLLEFLGRLVDSRPIAVAAAAALGAVIGDAALTPRIDDIAVECHGATRMTAGAKTVVTIVVTQTSRRPRKVASLVIDHDDPALGHTRVLAGRLTARRTALRITAVPTRRGRWAAGVGTTALEGHSPLGGFVRRRRRPITAARWVHPAPAAPVTLPDLASPLASGTTGVSRAGNGNDFYGVREWRSGDPAATVHWRASARRNRLVVMERERPPATPLVVMVGPPAAHADREVALSRAAATAVLACRAGRPVTLLDASGLATPGSAGAVLDWFAELDTTRLDTAVDDRPDRPVPSRPPPGATVLWVSGEPVSRGLAAELRATGGAVIAIGSPPDPGARP